MPELEIAMCVIEQEDSFLLQYRNGDPGIGAAGLYGCFGGKIEKGENPVQAAVRELSEETNILIDDLDLEEIGVVKVESDYKNSPINIIANVFHLILDSKFNVESKEGELISVNKQRINEFYDRMTPATKKCFKELIKE